MNNDELGGITDSAYGCDRIKRFLFGRYSVTFISYSFH